MQSSPVDAPIVATAGAPLEMMPDNHRTARSGVGPDAASADRAVGVDYRYRLRFTQNAFAAGNPTVAEVFPAQPQTPHRVLVCLDQGVDAAWPTLRADIDEYFQSHSGLIRRAGDVLILPGGEVCKNNPAALQSVIKAIHDAGICRQSFVLAIGGGAVLDVVGFAAATAHRGVRLIRVPTTTLAQGDAGIGVKNGVNAFGKKNFLGSFAVPWAVINDEAFLTTLSERDWHCGFSEAIKVALVKDADYFHEIEAAALLLHSRDAAAASPIIERCATMHLDHIIDGGDPFELTTARPLDFGHWAAHKLEQMSGWTLPHGEAVAIGIALDVTYATIIGLLCEADSQRILTCLESLGFTTFDPHMDDSETLLQGLEEFREHLGGKLTVQLLEGIGRGIDVHEIDASQMLAAIDSLRQRSRSRR